MRQDFILLNKIRDNIPTDIFGGLMKDAVYLITVSQGYLTNNGYRRDVVDEELLPTLVYYYVFQHSCGDNKLRGFIDELSIEDVTRQTFYDYLDEVLDANLSHPIPRAINFAIAVKAIRDSSKVGLLSRLTKAGI